MAKQAAPKTPNPKTPASPAPAKDDATPARRKRRKVIKPEVKERIAAYRGILKQENLKPFEIQFLTAAIAAAKMGK